jgi:Cupin domain
MMRSLDLLPLYALRALAADDVASVEQLLAEQPSLRPQLEVFRAVAAELAILTPPVVPSAHVRTRLLASVGAGRFEHFTAAFSKIFDLTADGARQLLAWIDDPTKWQQVMPHFAVIHFAGGPACAGADTGFVRLAPGGVFPYHAHGGEELTLVLAGSAMTSDGHLLRAGDQLREVAGTAHDFVSSELEDFIYATRVFGVQFGIAKPPA